MTEKKMQLADWLDDLCVRFIINNPSEELTSPGRICFQIEEAQWFYEDFIRPLDPKLPSRDLRRFCADMFRHCPLLQPFADQAEEVYREFLAYKNRVPVRGAIMLNHAMDSVVMVRGWKSSSAWSFPRGKINKDEKDIDCAVREVYEETGYDIQAAGLVPQDEEHAKHIRKSLRGQDISLYVFRSVPEDTYFEPRTRKEIGKIDWFKIEHLPSLKKGPQNVPSRGGESVKESNFYNVVPFLQPLKSWISQQRRLDKQHKRLAVRNTVVLEEDTTEAEEETPYVDGESEAPIEFDDPEAEAQPNADHFNRLLSGLASNAEREVVEPVNLPEVSGAQATTEDLAAALKRMLSVGGPGSGPAQQLMPNQIPEEKEAMANPLLFMLRGPQQMARHGFLPPHTPADQILPTPAAAHTPHHNHPRQPQFPMGPPPGYGLHPNQVQPLQQPHHPQGPRPFPQQQQLQFGHGFPPNGQPQYQMPMQTAQTFSTQGSSSSRPGLSQIVQRSHPSGLPQAPNAYQQIGDSQSATSYPQYDQNIVTPSASRLPPPKLTSHALNLLNVFKSPAAQPAHPIHMNRPSASGLEVPEPRAPPQQTVPPSHLRPVEFSSPELAQPQAQKPRNQHQDALLNLFRSPSTSATQPQNLPQQRKEPVELSAQSSPHIGHPRTTSGHQHPIQATQQVQQKLSMRRLPNLNTNSPQNIKHSPGLTSATVSGPLNAPDFATVRKNQKPAELGTGASPNMEAPPQQQQSFYPTAILSRAPQSQRQQQVQHQRMAPPLPSQTPPVPVHTVNGKTAMEAPRPFHPLSILKRQEEGLPGENEPKQEPKQPPPMLPGAVPLLPKSQMGHQPPPMLPGAVPLVPKDQMGPPPPYHQQKHSVLPREDSFNRREIAPADQKSTLLGLFAAKPSVITPIVHAHSQAPPSGVESISVPNEQKQQLLSLFGPAKSAVTAHAQNHGHIGSAPVSAYPGNASGVNSPVSPLPAHAAPVRGDSYNSAPTSAPNSVPLPNPGAGSGVSGLRGGGFSGYNEGDARSRISSVASISGGDQGRLSRKGTSALPGNVESGSGAQSPITPKEKNFLLDYLMGVAKEGDRNTNDGR
ncbi:hypothetical protein E2P81_ATG05861 [Venturia nashicola]|uniref:Nudix hydrolase domain-containing protein n=1 Tax=Venturia nashicola TaxID=86259 RepID=A0A4Z1NW81_9PEZI|nr:hypothetical protein E6O75_ATG06008 [Venturia nashicola]TLD29567.1 hypothetical protein E2P81_ATG05861 [Venturia nashicola]